MTDKEIIKALECCTKDDCDKCPNNFGNCYANLAGYALDLINRQKAEKEALINGQETLQKYIAEQKAEIERLSRVRCHFPDDNYCKVVEVNEENEILKEENKQLVFNLKNAKAEAIKEFAERFKGVLDTELRWCECVDEITKPLDNLVKEMVGEDNGGDGV